MARPTRLQGRVGRAKRVASKLRRPPQVRTTALPFVPDARRGRWILAGEHSRSCGQFSASRVERAPEVLPAARIGLQVDTSAPRVEHAARSHRFATSSVRSCVNSFKGGPKGISLRSTNALKTGTFGKGAGNAAPSRPATPRAARARPPFDDQYHSSGRGGSRLRTAYGTGPSFGCGLR